MHAAPTLGTASSEARTLSTAMAAASYHCRPPAAQSLVAPRSASPFAASTLRGLGHIAPDGPSSALHGCLASRERDAHDNIILIQLQRENNRANELTRVPTRGRHERDAAVRVHPPVPAPSSTACCSSKASGFLAGNFKYHYLASSYCLTASDLCCYSRAAVHA